MRHDDMEHIRRLKYRYVRFMDTGDLDAMGNLFAPDATALFVGGTFRFEIVGREAIVKFFKGSFTYDAISRHSVNHPEIDVLTETTAEGIWYLTDYYVDLNTLKATNGAALYRDRYEKIDGDWKIKHTGYTRIFEIVDQLTERPNLTSHYLATVKPAPAG
jgi:uncharacterized protein (TIGR02246 family)